MSDTDNIFDEWQENGGFYRLFKSHYKFLLNNLTSAELRLYQHHYFLSLGQYWNTDNNTPRTLEHISTAEHIARELNCSGDTIRRLNRQLRAMGLIEYHQLTDKVGSMTTYKVIINNGLRESVSSYYA